LETSLCGRLISVNLSRKPENFIFRSAALDENERPAVLESGCDAFYQMGLVQLQTIVIPNDKLL
jgi:hypothetical protein